VDLILTGVPPQSVARGTRRSPDDQMASKIILENLQVLAAGQNIQKDVDGKPQTVQQVTVLVTPEEAEKIALATGDGRIQLALRNPLDHKSEDPPLVFKSALYEGSEILEAKPQPKAPPASARRARPPVVRQVAAPSPPPPPPPKLFTVELIQGSKRATQDFEEKPLDTSKPEEKKPQF